MNAPTMLNEREVILAGLADSVWKLDPAMATEFAQRAIAIGMDAYEAINDGLAKGMMVVSGKFDRREYFVPELLRAAKAMNTGIDLLGRTSRWMPRRTRARWSSRR
jgi:methanogenic corrinoid protein MtbC1